VFELVWQRNPAVEVPEEKGNIQTFKLSKRNGTFIGLSKIKVLVPYPLIRVPNRLFLKLPEAHKIVFLPN